jgi:protein-L-isoaspartate(D-aspartate) O-methyltransferase
MIDLNAYGTAQVFAWSKEYLLNVLITGKNPIVTDPVLINALKRIDRKDFVPYQLESKAYTDVELDIGYNEKLNKPTVIAQMLALLKPKYGGKYLDIGTGTGYSAMVLGFVAGDIGQVYSIERIQWLWEAARKNGSKYPDVKNVKFLYRDGMEGLIQQAPFDGIHIAFALDQVPENSKQQLRVGGILVCPTTNMDLRVVHRESVEDFTEEIVPGVIFDKGKTGVG